MRDVLNTGRKLKKFREEKKKLQRKGGGEGHTKFIAVRPSHFVIQIRHPRCLLSMAESATTGLATWLERECKLEPNEIAMVMGTSVQYQIAELADPESHVVARIRKDALAGLK